MDLHLNPRQTPSVWTRAILARANPFATVIPQFVYASYRKQFQAALIRERPIIPAYRNAAQINRFEINDAVFLVTEAVSKSAIRHCVHDHQAGLLPIIIIPESAERRARRHLAASGYGEYITLLSVEFVVSFRVTMQACDTGRDHLLVFHDIVALYNQRMTQLQADPSMLIHLN